MKYHQASAIADSQTTSLSSHQPAFNGSKLLVSIVITIVTCLALTLLGSWPSSTKRNLWAIFVYLTPSPFIYAMEFPHRRKWRGGQGNVGFGRKDFGNQQAKSEALQRVLGFDDSLAAAVQHARRLTGLDNAIGTPADTPPGLGNWDNSCYQNSIIQGLASLSSFDDFLVRNMEAMSQDDNEPTHDALRNILGKLNHSDNEGKRLWIPPALKSMNSWQQQDAQEYFSRIMDEVDKELSRAVRANVAELGFRGSGDGDKPSRFWQCNPFQGLLAQRVGCTRCGYTEGLSLLPFTCITVNLGVQWEYDVRDCLDDYTALESIEGVECIKCTILRTKASLEHVLLNIDSREASNPATGNSSASVSTLRHAVTERLHVIDEICESGDFSDSGLYKKCNISAKSKVTSTKSKQAVIARPPKDLVIHVNRSIFDATGVQRKNHARVRFPLNLSLHKWCLGSDFVETGKELLEHWNTSPSNSMLPEVKGQHSEGGNLYKLRAVITHYGGHENGHYIAYRKRSRNNERCDRSSTGMKETDESWFCFSDDVVSPVSEDHVLLQGGVFMLFYEAVGQKESFSPVPAQSSMEQSTLTATEASTVSIHEEDDQATILSEGKSEPESNQFDSALSARGAAPLPDFDSPPEPDSAAEPSPSPSKRHPYPTVATQTESIRPTSLAPIMRTAGALSPKSRRGRRSSNISIHSPSFVRAS